jgi:GMP synthase (glutamine-hydrolysing)
MPVLHWHGDAFTIPAGARHLARTPGFPHQAFHTETALALQFHLEADHRAIESWLIGHAHELQHHGIDPRTIRDQAATFGPTLEGAAHAAIGAWLDEVEPPSDVDLRTGAGGASEA